MPLRGPVVAIHADSWEADLDHPVTRSSSLWFTIAASIGPVASDLFGCANAVPERLDRAGGVLGDGVFVELQP